MKKSRISLSGALKQEFQKDLELFKHLLLLVNNSGPIRNVELMWNEEDEVLDPVKPKFKSRVGTEDAVVQLQPLGSIGANRIPRAPCFATWFMGLGRTRKELARNPTCRRQDAAGKPVARKCTRAMLD